MTKEQRPTSKLKKVTSSDPLLFTEHEDGSLWKCYANGAGPWECILEAHKEPVEEEPTTKESLTVDKEPNKPTESKKPLLSKEVEEALEGLGGYIRSPFNEGADPKREFNVLLFKALYLVNALEAHQTKQ